LAGPAGRLVLGLGSSLGYIEQTKNKNYDFREFPSRDFHENRDYRITDFREKSGPKVQKAL